MLGLPIESVVDGDSEIFRTGHVFDGRSIDFYFARCLLVNAGNVLHAIPTIIAFIFLAFSSNPLRIAQSATACASSLICVMTSSSSSG